MEQENLVLKCGTLIFSDTKEQAIECEMLLPDYYPEVEKVLHCGLELSEESVTLHTDKISVAGRAGFTLIFLSAEKEIRSFTFVEKYTKLIPCGETRTDDVCKIRQTQTVLNYTVSAPRKIELRAAAAVHAELYRFTQAQALSGLAAASAETLSVEAPYFESHALQTVTLDLLRTVKLPVAREQVSAVLRKSVGVELTECKAIANKVMLDGALDVALSLAAKDGTVYRDLQFRLPLSEVRDVFGVEENDECFCCEETVTVEVNLKTTQGEADACELQVRGRCTLLTGKKTKVCFLKDAYALSADLHTTAAPVQMDSAVVPIQTTFPFSAQAECYDDTAAEICDAYVSDIRVSCAAEKGGVELSGSAAVNALIKNKAGGFSFVSRSATFSFEKQESPLQRQRMYAVTCKSLSASFAGSGLLQFNGEFCLRGFELEQTTEEMLTSAVLPESEAVHGVHEKIVVYYAAKGERLWEIAKENRSTVRQISAQNQLTSDVLEEPAVLVFPAY